MEIADIEQSLGPEEGRRQRDLIVERFIPEFKAMCTNYSEDTKTIILTSAAFSDEPRDVEMLGLAIKYANDRGFEVMVVPLAASTAQRK